MFLKNLKKCKGSQQCSGPVGTARTTVRAEPHAGILLIMGFLVLTACIPATLAADTTEKVGYITVGLAPVAHFESNYAYNVVPTTVAFQDFSTGTKPLTYLWDFGDGGTSADANPSHTYIRQGLYTVSLTVTNRYGTSTETKTDYIAIGLGPRAAFTAHPTTGSVPLIVMFTDQSTGHPTSWKWYFGDGSTSTEQNPYHSYRAAGDYTVILSVSNEYGSSDTSKAYLIHVIPALNARFTAKPDYGNVPLVVKFTDTSTGTPEAWYWDFGDGTTSAEPDPVHTFTTPGTYDVNLTVTRGMDKDSAFDTITAGGVPLADFVADATTVGVGTAVRFTDQSKYDPESWSWDFGDGGKATGQNPVHTYTVKGIYTVALTATNKNGADTEIKKGYITVGVVPVADFSVEIPSYQRGTRVQYARFTDYSKGNPTEWLWDFGDGTTSTEQNPPLHFYNRDGSYTVSLTAMNMFGQDTEVKRDIITVREGPRVDFVADKTRVSVNRYVHFTDLSTNNPVDWLWDFGDGQLASVQNPDHVYRQEGTYSVTLTVSDGRTTISHRKAGYITVVEIPEADFEADKIKGVTPFSVSFTDKSAGNPTSWKWDFGDGTTSAEQNPVHTYKTAEGSSINAYTVKLTAVNKNGEDTKTKEQYITVTMGPVAEFTVDERSGKAPFIVKFRDLSTGNPATWKWEFGDGTVSFEQNPVHLYPYEGAYDVRLTVANAYGTDTIFKTGTSSQRGSASPVPLTPAATTVVKTTVMPETTEQETSPSPAGTPVTASATTTYAPVSPVIPVIAIGTMLAVLALAKRRY